MMMMVITSILIFQAPCSEARAGARRLHFEAAVEKVFLEARKAAVCPNPTRGSARKSKYLDEQKLLLMDSSRAI